MILYYWQVLRKHTIMLTATPLFMALLVMLLLWHKKPEYSSTAIINTGFASGVSLESLSGGGTDYLAINSSFDNLINIIKSRATREEVAIRLLASHLQMQQGDPRQISPDHFQRLVKSVPAEVKKLVSPDSERTVANLFALKNSSQNNFILNLLYHTPSHYSLATLERIQAQRLAVSDLLEIRYTTDDPGISRQTLSILLQVLIQNYRATKASSSNDVVAYFVEQLSQSAQRLRDSEERYAQFNKSHRIINYYEETKSIAIHKDNINLTLQEDKMKNAAAEATLRHLEKVLPRADVAMLQSQTIIAKRNQVADLTAQIAAIQVTDSTLQRQRELIDLHARSTQLKSELQKDLVELQTSGRSVDNLPTQPLLDRWLENAILADESRARLTVMQEYKREFDKYYDTFSPLGSLIKRQEREIGVLEQEYLELLHSLTLAKLKQQNIEIANQLRILDEPGFPQEPEPEHAKKLLLLSLFSGFLLAAGFIVLADYFSTAVKNPERAQRMTGLTVAGVMPYENQAQKSGTAQPLLQQSISFLIQQIEFKRRAMQLAPGQPFVLLVFSTEEDATDLPARSMAQALRDAGRRTISLCYRATAHTLTWVDRETACYSEKTSFETTLEGLKEPGNARQESPDADYILIEVPAIKARKPPLALFDRSHYALLICRADRPWNRGDDVALANVRSLLSCEIQCVLAATDEWECRQWLGIRAMPGRGPIARIMQWL
jgi:uncharacterized protein involved in exopolysaccharide biosynthesis